MLDFTNMLLNVIIICIALSNLVQKLVTPSCQRTSPNCLQPLHFLREEAFSIYSRLQLPVRGLQFKSVLHPHHSPEIKVFN